jgi:TonB family protein
MQMIVLQRSIFLCAFLLTSAYSQHHPDIQQFSLSGYPPVARQARIEGTVKAVIHLSADGHVTSISDVQGPVLLRGVTEDIKKWIFAAKEPANVTINISFSLRAPERTDAPTSITVKLPYDFEISTNYSAEKPAEDRFYRKN